VGGGVGGRGKVNFPKPILSNFVLFVRKFKLNDFLLNFIFQESVGLLYKTGPDMVKGFILKFMNNLT